MITIILKHHNKQTEVDTPVMYEELQLALWKLGLDREPEKYTLIDLGATFRYQSPLEYFILRLLEGEMTLLDAVSAIYSVIAPPRPIIAQVHILSSGFKSISELRLEIDRLIKSTAQFGSTCFFLSGDGLWDWMVKWNRPAMPCCFSTQKLLAMLFSGCSPGSSMIWHSALRIQRTLQKNPCSRRSFLQDGRWIRKGRSSTGVSTCS